MVCFTSWGQGGAGELSKAFRSETASSCITQLSEERHGQNRGLCMVQLLCRASGATVLAKRGCLSVIEAGLLFLLHKVHSLGLIWH